MKVFQHLSLLLNQIVQNYFLDSRCLIILRDENSSINIKSEKIPVINVKIHENVWNKNVTFGHYGCQGILIHHENATKIFTEFERLIKEVKERYNVRKYIVATNNNGSDEIFQQDKTLKFVSDFLVIELTPNPDENHEKNEEIYEISTHSLFDFRKIFLDKWYSRNNSFLCNNDLYPDKLYNQEGRELAIGTLSYEPYSIIDDEGQTFDGTETSFVLEYAKKFNMTPVFTVVPGDNSWGDIYENWTGTGLLGVLLEDEVDLAYAAFYSWDAYYNYLDYSKPLTRSGATAIVPAPKLTSGLLTPLLSFSVKTWLIIAFCFILNTFVFFLLINRDTPKKTHRDRKQFCYSLMTMLRILLLQTLPLPLNKRLIKYFIALNLLYVLLITSAYSSGLSSIMTIPRYERSIKNVKDLAERGLKWGAPSDVWLITLNEITDDADFITITKNFIIEAEEKLVKYAEENNFGFIVERLHYGNYAVGTYVKSDVISTYRIMPEDIYWQYCIFMTRKSSILLPAMDDLLLRAFEGGLAAYWENHAVLKYMDMSVQQGIRFYTHHLKEQKFVKLRWIHVEGAFTILFIGYSAAGIVFIYEILREHPEKFRRYLFRKLYDNNYKNSTST